MSRRESIVSIFVTFSSLFFSMVVFPKTALGLVFINNNHSSRLNELIPSSRVGINWYVRIDIQSYAAAIHILVFGEAVIYVYINICYLHLLYGIYKAEVLSLLKAETTAD